MKFVSRLSSGLFLTAVGSAAIAMGAPPVMMTPDNLHWAPGVGLQKGLSTVVLSGNPNKSGLSIMRVKLPNGWTSQPHYHAHPEAITVIKGALLFGTGDTVNKAKARLMPAGSFMMIPPGVHHWSVAQGETIEQVGGQGPLVNTPVKHGGM